MALTAVEKLGSNANSGSTTITVSPSRNIEVGEFIVLTIAQRDHSITSLADNSAQAGTANSYVSDTSRQTADPFCHIYSCQVTRKILTTDTITLTLADAGGGTSICLMALPDADASSQLDKATSAFVFNPGSTYSSGTTPTTAQADEYAIGVAVFANSVDDAGTITADSPWTLQHSDVPAGGGAAHGSRVLTATGAYAFTGGWGVDPDGDQSGCIATYRGTAGGGTATGASDVALTFGAATDGTPTAYGAAAEPITIGIGSAGVYSQVIHPSADSVDGAWTDQAGGSSLAAAIDELTPSDSDYIKSEDAPSNSGCRVKLGSSGDPQSSSGHAIRWRVSKDAPGGDTINVTVKLMQGGADVLGAGTEIASFDRLDVIGLVTYTETLTGLEADAITDYSDLYLEFYANTA